MLKKILIVSLCTSTLYASGSYREDGDRNMLGSGKTMITSRGTVVPLLYVGQSPDEPVISRSIALAIIMEEFKEIPRDQIDSKSKELGNLTHDQIDEAFRAYDTKKKELLKQLASLDEKLYGERNPLTHVISRYGELQHEILVKQERLAALKVMQEKEAILQKQKLEVAAEAKKQKEPLVEQILSIYKEINQVRLSKKEKAPYDITKMEEEMREKIESPYFTCQHFDAQLSRAQKLLERIKKS
jgi:hypothetical protein